MQRENHRWEQLAVLAVDIILLGTLSCQFCGAVEEHEAMRHVTLFPSFTIQKKKEKKVKSSILKYRIVEHNA